MTTFVLVHGSMHGAWCWDLLRPELERTGHDVVAPNLPCDDPKAGVDDYAGAVIAAVDAAGYHGDSGLILVGHSLGGCTIPVVASRIPVTGMVYLCCAPLLPGETALQAFAGALAPQWATAERITNADGTSIVAPGSARDVYYNDCDDDLVEWATSRLRPQGARPVSEPLPIERLPDVPVAVILASDDHAVSFDWAAERARRIARVEPVVLPGDHSPFLARPAQLAEALLAFDREITGDVY